MRYLLLLAIVFVSLCTQLPIEIPFLTPVQESSLALEVTTDPNLYLKVETLPKEVKEGKNISIFFEMRNKGDSILENINLYVYDQCIFSDGNKKTISVLKPDRTERWSWRWKAGNIELPTDCKIKFRTDYESNFSLFQDVAVLTESEYYIKEQEGTLESIPISSSSSYSPLSISVSFLEKQPFLEEDEITMTIGYSYIGDGIMNVSDITIDIPNNLQFVSCSDYNYIVTESCKGIATSCSIFTDPILCPKQKDCSWKGCDGTAKSCDSLNETECPKQKDCTWNATSNACEGTATVCSDLSSADCPNQQGCTWIGCDGTATQCSELKDSTCSSQEGCSWFSKKTLQLKRKLNFINKRASPSNCKFTTKASQPMDIKSLSLTASYKYVLDNSISVRVKK